MSNERTETEQVRPVEPEAPPAAPPAGEPEPDAAADQVAGDLDELAVAARERDEYLDLARRTQADFENYRKRVARERADAEARGVAKLAGELLPALDNLGRALSAAEAGGEHLAEGIRLVQSELESALVRVGIERFSPEGEPFDPTEHEAMASQPAPPGTAPGAVIEVYQPGYRFNGSVLRPARVVVAANPAT